MKEGTAVRRGCCRPRPPLANDKVEMTCAWEGRVLMPRMSTMNESSISVNVVDIGLVQLNQSSGRVSALADMTSLLKR